jgi:hypothetical protein
MMTTLKELKPAVAQAIEEIHAQFPDSQIITRDDGQGGAFVILESVLLSPTYTQTDTWVGFHITFQYPYADVYPHFIRADLSRVDGKPLGGGTGSNSFEGRQAVQLSRRSNRLNPATDTALLKLLKVLEWLRNH